jgi:hypothetical protein
MEKIGPAYLTTTKIRTMEVKYFKVKHKVLKNSLQSQIWSYFEKFTSKNSKRRAAAPKIKMDV